MHEEQVFRAPRRNFPNQPLILVVGFWDVTVFGKSVIFCMFRNVFYVGAHDLRS